MEENIATHNGGPFNYSLSTNDYTLSRSSAGTRETLSTKDPDVWHSWGASVSTIAHDGRQSRAGAVGGGLSQDMMPVTGDSGSKGKKNSQACPRKLVSWELRLNGHLNIVTGGRGGCSGLICKYDSNIVASQR
jgi:hypothetical protein